MNLQLAGNVSTVRNHRVHRDIEAVGNLLVLQTLYHTDYHVTLTVRECLARVLSSLEHHRRDVLRHVVLLQALFHATDGRCKDVVFHVGMLLQPFLIVIDVVERGRQLAVQMGIARQILNNE